MKKLDFVQMENLQGGQTVSAYDGGIEVMDGSAKLDCALACGLALVTGTGGIIGTALTGGAGIGFAIAANWLTWGGAAYTCGRASGKF
jgi:hypothetical protein